MGILDGDGGVEPFHYAAGEVFALVHRFVYGSVTGVSVLQVIAGG